jgi:peptidyl-prolyl cis-trans isomerase SurA
MKFTTKIILLLLIVATTQTFAQKRTRIDGVASVIGNNIVLYSEIRAAKLQIEEQSEGKSTMTECQIFEKIMNDKLLAHHAVVDSLTVEDAYVNGQVDRKLAYFASQFGGSTDKMLEFFGFENLKDFKKELFNVEKEATLVKKMQAKITESIDVTPEEVGTYFNSLKEENSIPEFTTEIVLGQIVLEAKPTKKESEILISKLNELKKDIENGSNFKMKAILYSQDPAVAQNGGMYEITQESQFVKEFKEAAFSLEEGEISEPFKSQFGYHIVKVEKIKGKMRSVRHILLQAEISDSALKKVQDSLTKIKKDILTQKISFEDAVKKFSSDKETNKNKGLLINPETNDTHFKLTRMDPALYARVSNLKIDEISDVFYDENREGQKMFKIMIIKEKIETHTADLNKDYVKIKNLALAKKKQELVAKWSKDKIKDTYIKIQDQYKNCTFEYNWSKK